jgi:hypothetical protein
VLVVPWSIAAANLDTVYLLIQVNQLGRKNLVIVSFRPGLS